VKIRIRIWHVGSDIVPSEQQFHHLFMFALGSALEWSPTQVSLVGIDITLSEEQFHHSFMSLPRSALERC